LKGDRKMKIVLFGDSITDMGRNREEPWHSVHSLGDSYSFLVASELSKIDPYGFELHNKGIAGNRVVDLYARIKSDVWNIQPDVLSILIGTNDVWHELEVHNGVDIERYEKIYSMLIEDTKKVLPNVKIILLEPFFLKGTATEEKYDSFLQIKDYAKVVKRLAEKYDLPFIPLQEKFDEVAKKYEDTTQFLLDGVHPNIAGATLIAEEWMKCFRKEILK